MTETSSAAQNAANSSQAAAVLEADEISVSFGSSEILQNVSLRVRPGEVLGLIGPNGAGKSTLLAALAGDLQPERGDVKVDSRSYSSLNARQAAQRRGVMLQDTSVTFSHTVRDIVGMGRTPWPADPAGDSQIVDESLDVVEMTALQHRSVTSLSGGERARVALARVVAQQPRVFLLDEPTAAMDIGYQEKTMELVRQLAATGAAVIVILHDLNLAAHYCDTLVLLADGQVRAEGAPAEVCTEENLSSAYGWAITVSEVGDRELWIRPQRGPVHPSVNF